MGNILKQLENYVSDIEKKSINMGFLDRLSYTLQNRMASAALGANPFTILKQYSSYLLETNEIPAKYLLKAQFTKSDLSEIQKYSPILTDRIKGNVSMELGELGKVASVRELFGNYSGILDNLPQMLTKGITAADRQITGKTWNAVKMMVKEQNPSISQEELLTQTARKVEEILRHTNSAATMLDRSATGRSTDTLTRAVTIFTSQTNIMLNSAVQSVLELNRSSRTAKDYATVAKKLVTIYILANIMEQSVDRLRDKIKGQDDEPWNVPMDILEGILSQVYLVGKAFTAFRSKVEYGKYFGYDFSIPQLQMGEQLINLAVDINTLFEQTSTQEIYKSGEHKGTLKWKQTITSMLDEIASISAKLNGIPYDSVKSLIESQFNK